MKGYAKGYKKPTEKEIGEKKSNKPEEETSAVSYLLTYGWAILIILIVAAVLAYYGIFRPSGMASADCSVPENIIRQQLLAANSSSVISVDVNCTAYAVQGDTCLCKIYNQIGVWKVTVSQTDWKNTTLSG